MQDITNGRINCENLTDEEWQLLESSEDKDWFVPSKEQWILLMNLLALFKIRRGFSIQHNKLGEPFIRAGTVQIKLSIAGQVALDMRSRGKFYKVGEPNTFEQFAPHMTEAERELFENWEGYQETQSL